MKVLDLFSGIGGFSLGLERAGMKTIAFCEIDPFCQKVLKKHWPDVPCFTDITKLKKEDLNGEQPDLICGGFPCQDISVAGRQKGLSGERSGLWWEMLRVIAEVRPHWVLVENVPNLRTKGADEVLASLEKESYSAWATVVGAWATGAIHKRDRVWLLAYAQHVRPSTTTLGSGNGASVLSSTEGKDETRELAGVLASRLVARQVEPADDGSERVQGKFRETVSRKSSFSWCQDVRRLEDLFDRPHIPQPLIRGTGHGVSDRVDRTIALGNSVVPQIPELFGKFIMEVEKSR